LLPMSGQEKNVLWFAPGIVNQSVDPGPYMPDYMFKLNCGRQGLVTPHKRRLANEWNSLVTAKVEQCRGLSAPSNLVTQQALKLLDQEVQRASALQALFEHFITVVGDPGFEGLPIIFLVAGAEDANKLC